jgi:hypothetical protein
MRVPPAVRFEITRPGIDVVAPRTPGGLAADRRPIWIVGLTSLCGQGAVAGFVVRAVSEQRDHGVDFGRNPGRQLAPPERNVSIDNVARIAKAFAVEPWKLLKDG